MWPPITRLVGPTAPPHRRFLPTTRPAARVDRGLYPGEPEACRRRAGRFLAVLAHLVVLVAVAEVYRLEGRAFRIVLIVAAAALPVHYLLPLRWKAPFFAAASATGLAIVFGAGTAAAVLVIAAAMVGLSFLPIAWGWRVGLAMAAGAGLAAARAWAPDLGVGLSGAAWPVLGSMLMFRLPLWLHDRRHAKAPASVADAASYFVMLPNFCFLHFPVVDCAAMRRGYFAAEIHAVQRSGLGMIGRGLVHLIAYRLIDHHLLPAAGSVNNPASLAAFVACTYLLYLRVSGQFHVACGLLHLFGYKLPETHHRYLLATGFTDYWRRINIYWKDFMVKLVFHPVAFRLKRRPQATALAAATAAVFLATWALHGYQSFWLRGSWGFSGPDAAFWGVLGLLVMVNVQLDARRGGRARVNPATATEGGWAAQAGALAIRAAKVVGTFATIALLWSLWSSPSLSAWLGLVRRGLGVAG